MQIDDNDFKQLIFLLQKLVDDKSSKKNTDIEETDISEDTEDDSDDTDSKHIARSKKQKNIPQNKKTKRPKFVNNFLKMKEASMHKDDIAIDKKLSKQPPIERSRNYKPISVRCRVCGKTEEVSPGLVESMDRYKCNKCATCPG